MIIDYNNLDREKFSVERGTILDGLRVVLVNPTKNGVFSWRQEDLHLRSLLLREETGEVISAGFPKFFNFGEDAASDAVARAAVLARHGSFRQKMDGTLIIRSVIDGHVHFRTRGSIGLGVFEEPVLNLITARYPELLNPELGKLGSALFEYTAPTNQHVLRYGESTLTALAHVRWSAQYGLLVFETLLEWESTRRPASMFFASTSPNVVAHEVRQLTHEEGYVLWAPLEARPSPLTWTDLSPYGVQLVSYRLSKWKTQWYIDRHGLRSMASPRFIAEYCARYGTYTLDDFKAQLQRDGFDWETVSYLEPMFFDAKRRHDTVREQVSAFEAVCNTSGVQEIVASGNRRDLALKLQAVVAAQETPWLFNYGMMKYTGKQAEAEDFVAARILDIGMNALRTLKKEWASTRKDKTNA